MASDWIKMRSDLYRDPRVCVIAESLHAQDGALAGYVNQNMQRDMSVTRNVMRNATVGALVSVWGVMRQRGKRIDNDLVCVGVSVSVLDDIAELPGFGAAMQFSGWVRQDGGSIVFPKFFDEYNTDPSASKAAERQRRFREKHRNENNVVSNVTRNVTVTHREEKRREEKKEQKQKTAPDGELFEGVSGQVIADFKALRSKLRAPVTATAMAGIRREAEKAGLSMNDALAMCCERGWRGFNAGWVNGSTRAKEQTAGTPRKRRMLA